MRNCAIFVLASYCLVLKCFKYYMTMAVSLVLKDLRISCSILADPMRMWNWIIYEMQQKKKIYIPRGCCDSAAVCCVLVGLGEARGTPLRRTWGSLPGRLSAFGCFSSLPPPPLGLGWPHIRASTAPCAAEMSIEGKTCWSCGVAQLLHGCVSKRLLCPHLPPALPPQCWALGCCVSHGGGGLGTAKGVGSPCLPCGAGWELA